MDEKIIITNVPIESLKPNPWNTNIVSPENQKKIENSIKRLGFFKPIIVRILEDGSKEIIGGQHRWEAARALGIESVPTLSLGAIDDKQAKEISLIDNGRYGSDDAGRLAELLRELGNSEDLSEYMPYTADDLTTLFASAEVDLDGLSMDDDEETEEKVEELTKGSPTYRVMRFKVPIDDADFVQGVIDGIQTRQGFTGSDSLTNAGDALVYLCGRER